MKKYSLKDKRAEKERVYLEKIDVKQNESPHTHDFIEIVYIAEGTGRHYIDNTLYNVKKGDILFINYKQLHAYAASDKMIQYNILLTPKFISETLNDNESINDVFAFLSLGSFDYIANEEKQVISFKGLEMLEVDSIVQNMEREFLCKYDGYQAVLKSYMQVLFFKIIRKIQDVIPVDVRECISSTLLEVLNYVEKNLSKKISISELANKSFYSPQYFSRAFKQCYGKTLTEYIIEERMKKAMELLKESDMSVEHIAHEVGYTDRSRFYKVFKRAIGITPGEYRRKLR